MTDQKVSLRSSRKRTATVRYIDELKIMTKKKKIEKKFAKNALEFDHSEPTISLKPTHNNQPSK